MVNADSSEWTLIQLLLVYGTAPAADSGEVKTASGGVWEAV